MGPSICCKTNQATTEPSPAFVLNWDFKPATEPQPIPTSTVKPFIPVTLETPVNYWDALRAREGIVERNLTPAQYGQEMRLAVKKAEEERQKEVTQRLLKKRKSDEDWGKYFYFYFKN